MYQPKPRAVTEPGNRICLCLRVQSTGDKITDELSRENAPAVVVELDWTESVDNPDDKSAPQPLSCTAH